MHAISARHHAIYSQWPLRPFYQVSANGKHKQGNALIDVCDIATQTKGSDQMSPHAVNNFVSDLVLMAQAMERLPHIEQELNDAKHELDKAHEAVQRLELKLLDRATTIDELNATVRKAEVDRDDAEYRFLEGEERTAKALAFIKDQFGSAGSLIQALEPPVKAKETISIPLELHPAIFDKPEPASGQAAISEHERHEIEAIPMQGQSAPDPIPATDTTQHSGNIDTDNVIHGGPMPKPDHGPYHGLKYIDVLGWISLSDWLAGGGTEADYHWRLNVTNGKGFGL